ncbi:hypothetical protein Tco_0758210 [Tanacetum coccineum]
MNQPSSPGPLPSNTIANPKGDLKAIITRSGVSYDGPPIPPPFSSSPKVVEREPKVTQDPVQPSTEKVQPLNVKTQAPTFEPVNAPKPKLNLPYPSRLNNQKLRERDDHQMMNNKDKLFELANTPVNKNCSSVILKKSSDTNCKRGHDVATKQQAGKYVEQLFSNEQTSEFGPRLAILLNNPKGDLKAITTRSGVSYDGPPIPPPFSFSPKVVEREHEVTKDPVQPYTEKVQPPDVPTQAPTSEPVNAPKPKPNLPYPSRLNNQKL